MEIVIDIDEHIYKQIMADAHIYVLDNEIDRILIENAIYNGTPLPEHHGRLIDADALYENTEICHSDEDGYACVRWKEINDAPTIIEADKEDADGK